MLPIVGYSFLITSEVQAQTPPNPIAHWTLDETSGSTAADSVGTNDGTWAGGPTPTTGQIGGALSLDGNNDHVTVPFSQELNITDDITIAAWVKRSVLTDYGGLVAKTGNGLWDYDVFFTNADNFVTFYSDNTSPQVVTSNGSITDTAWHHVAFTREGTTYTFYIDGVVSGSGTLTGSFGGNAVPLELGRDGGHSGGGSFPHFSGSLDDVRIYDRALSAGEVGELSAGN